MRAKRCSACRSASDTGLVEVAGTAAGAACAASAAGSTAQARVRMQERTFMGHLQKGKTLVAAPEPKGYNGRALSCGISGRWAATASIDEGNSNGNFPSGFARPVSTSINASSLTPKLARSARALDWSGVRIAGRSRYTVTIVGTTALTR